MNRPHDPISRSRTLEERLKDGERKIALAESQGQDTTRLVEFWIQLLRQYEQACDEEAQR